MDRSHRNYLLDLGHLIREVAEQSARLDDGDAFEQCRRTAYYDVVSLMLSQAAKFGLPAYDLAMSGLDPDRDLMGGIASQEK